LQTARLIVHPASWIDAGHERTTTRTAIMYITETSFTQYRQGAAAAMSYILAVALILLSMLNFWVLRRRSA